MKTVEETLCGSCKETLDASGLTYQEVPGSQQNCRCAFCKQKRYCTKYRIQYGRGRT